MIPALQRLLFGNGDGQHPANRVNNRPIATPNRQNGRPAIPGHQPLPRNPMENRRVEPIVPADPVPEEPIVEIVHPRYDEEFLIQLFRGTPRITIIGEAEGDIFNHRKTRLPVVTRYVTDLRNCHCYTEQIIRTFLEVAWGEVPVKMGDVCAKLIAQTCLFRNRENQAQLLNGLYTLRQVSAGKKRTGGLFYPNLYDYIILRRFFNQLGLYFNESKFRPAGVPVTEELMQVLEDQYRQIRPVNGGLNLQGEVREGEDRL